MPAPTTVNDFLEVVRRSGLVEEERLESFLADAPHLPESPRKLAGVLIGAGLLTVFQAEQCLLGKYRGFSIGKYRVLERLGVGGTGNVYLCEHVLVKRKVAVKVLPHSRANDPAALGRFYREARAAGVLNHPNLVRAHDVDQDENGLHFIVMDYVDGTSLQDIVTRFGPLPVPRAAHYVLQTALALQHAHEAGLIHRDVKPANILLDRAGTIRVLDLGLARFFADGDQLTLKYDEKNVLGTADYVSPEQALNSHEVDIRADVYSLGATFFFLLTGKPPFPDGKAAQKLICHQLKEPPGVRELRPEVPAEMAALVARMLAKKPEDRPQTPAAVSEALAPWTGEALPPPPEQEMPRLSMAARLVSMAEPDLGPVTPSSAARPTSLHALTGSGRFVDVPMKFDSSPGRKARDGRPLTPLFDSKQGNRSRDGRPLTPMFDSKQGLKGRDGRPLTPTPDSRQGLTARDGQPLNLKLGSEKGTRARDGRPLTSRTDLGESCLAESQVATGTDRGMDTAPSLPAEAPPAPPESPVVVRPSVKLVSARAGKAARTWNDRLRGLRLAAIFILGALAGLGVRRSMTPWQRATESPAPAALVVAHSQAPGTFPTIQAALKHARAGDRILVCEEIWEEALRLEGGDGLPADVHVEGGLPGNKAVVWRVPRTHRENDPLVRLSGTPQLSLRHFVLDGQDRVKDLVILEGPCPGLTLEDLHLKGFLQNGLVLDHCAGETDQPVSLQGLRVTPSRAAESALRFESHGSDTTRFVRLADSRLEGSYQAAVLLAGPVADVELLRNRVYNAVDGVLYRKGSPPFPVGLSLTSNTFCAMEKAGLHFECTPPIESSKVAMNSNLFARTRTLALTDDFSPEPRGCLARWVGRAEKSNGSDTQADRVFLRKKFSVDGPSVTQAILNIAGDQAFTVWLNGERVGHGELQAPFQRVQAFDVARFLRPGENVLAVQGMNPAGAALLLAQLTFACAGSAPVTLVSDATWKASRQGPDGWHKPAFNDGSWPAAAVAPAGGRRLSWDAVIQDQFRGRARQVFPEPSGNVRDEAAQESFPLFKAVPLNFDLPTDSADDAHFLRYARASLLTLAGSPGVPPSEARR